MATAKPEPSTVTLTVGVKAVSERAIKIDEPPFYPWLPKSQIVDSDADLDEIAAGDEIEIEIPL